MRDNGRLTYLIWDVLAELAAGRRDVERQHTALVCVPHVQHVVANLENVARLLGTARQAHLDILEQPLLVQTQQVRARRHPSSTFDRERKLRREVMAANARLPHNDEARRHTAAARAANFGS